ncbi:GTP-binding protein [uncultured Clostridium sp.]|uniref:GTP-binding protein n=1 Tax=uncultured Clostridium sp. TaxID=59620 RepID=UPI0025E6B569|nr:GTP-binding protein [uncultured Clostridium sp.]
MKQIKYMVTSGFLGAGKTTSMIAFARNINKRYTKAAILANDLGAQNIVDAEYTATTDVLTTQITGNCICYQHENLIDKLHQLVQGGAEVIFSDIPGCGIGALDHVYLEIKANPKEADEFSLMPFTCIVDPERLRMIMPEQADINLPEEMKFLLDAQMAEADVIVLNKIDTLSKEEKETRLAFIRDKYPSTPLYAMSALTGEGVDEVVDYLMTHTAAAEHREIGYGSEAFMAAEQKLSWYNRRVYLEERNDKNVDFNAILKELFEEIRSGLKKAGGNVPHLKAFAAGEEGDFVKMSLIGVDYEVEYASRLQKPYSAISVVVNARAAADSQVMAEIVDDALDAVCQKYNLKAKTFFMETFGMMEEGKGNGGRASRYE